MSWGVNKSDVPGGRCGCRWSAASVQAGRIQFAGHVDGDRNYFTSVDEKALSTTVRGEDLNKGRWGRGYPWQGADGYTSDKTWTKI